MEAARSASPDLRAAQHAVAAADARTRQSGAHPNPVLSYGREQTSRSGQTNAQDILAIEQRIEPIGARSARLAAALARRDAAEARLRAQQVQHDFETIRAYAIAAVADRRMVIASQAAGAFAQAARISEQRLAAGDVSGFAHRRIRLEAARYATMRAEAELTRRRAFATLSALVMTQADAVSASEFVLADSLESEAASPTDVPGAEILNAQPDSMIRFALRNRADLHASEFEAAAARADARLTSAERILYPALALGLKRDRVPDTDGTATGFVFGFSLPLPLWDRREGAVAASTAEHARLAAEVERQRRRVAQQVIEAVDAYRVLESQMDLLRPQLGAEAASAMRAVQLAYAEGEITLVEWLDAVRAYQEAESSYLGLRAETMIRRAALAAALGLPFVSPARDANSPGRN